MPNTSEASSISLLSEVEEVEEPQDIDYSTMTLVELKIIAKEQGIEGYSKLNKSQLIEKLG